MGYQESDDIRDAKKIAIGAVTGTAIFCAIAVCSVLNDYNKNAYTTSPSTPNQCNCNCKPVHSLSMK